MIVAELSTPTLCADTLTPSTVNDLTLNEDAPPPAPEPRADDDEDDDRRVPENRVSVRLSAPVAADTCLRWDICVSVAVESVPSPAETSESLLTLVAPLPRDLPAIRNPCGPPDPAFGELVTVTLYSPRKGSAIPCPQRS